MLALALLGLLPAGSHPETTGSVTVTGVDMQRAPDKELRRVRRESLGAIFQDPMTSLNPTMRIGRQIRESTGDDAESVRLLEAVGVRDATLRLRVHPHQLSGGLRQRVMAAIAVAGRPRLVIADEPTTALDVTVQAQLLDLLRELRDELGCSVLLITHDLGVADQIADRLAVLHHGELVELGPARTVVTHPSHAYTRSPAGVAAVAELAARRAVRRRGRARPRVVARSRRPGPRARAHVHGQARRGPGADRGRSGRRPGRGPGHRRRERLRQVHAAADHRGPREGDRGHRRDRPRRRADGVPGRRARR